MYQASALGRSGKAMSSQDGGLHKLSMNLAVSGGFGVNEIP